MVSLGLRRILQVEIMRAEVNFPIALNGRVKMRLRGIALWAFHGAFPLAVALSMAASMIRTIA